MTIQFHIVFPGERRCTHSEPKFEFFALSNFQLRMFFINFQITTQKDHMRNIPIHMLKLLSMKQIKIIVKNLLPANGNKV